MRHPGPLLTLTAGLILTGILTIASRAGERAAPESTPAVASRQRTAWTSSRIVGTPGPPSPYAVERVFPDLQFEQAVDLAVAPGSERIYVLELDGRLYSFPNDPSVSEPELVVDFRKHIDGLQRALGFTFDPGFEENGYIYVCYVFERGLPDGSKIARFRVTETDPPRCDPATEEILLEWHSGGHNGCCLKFGPDGYLYLSTGDGTPPSPPDGLDAGQDVSNLLSCILRIDVHAQENGRPYAIPDDNPFVDHPDARPEIWAYGFRNPWRMSFDPRNGDLWVGDVGWELWELVHRVERGGNYGWSIMEGPQPVRPNLKRGPTPITPPVVSHPHTESRSVTGGLVYTGDRLPGLRGAYVYGDYVTGKIWGLRYKDGEVTWNEELVDTPVQIIAFGRDPAGEMLILGHGGTLHRLRKRRLDEEPPPFPTKLSETGLFSSTQEHEPAPGVIPYSINAEPWADGAQAERLLAVPGRKRISVHEKQNLQRGWVKGAWKYPPGTVFAKTLSVQRVAGVERSETPVERSGGSPPARPQPPRRRRIETQILHRHGDAWRAYSYVWNDEQTDAVLASADGDDFSFRITDPAAPGGSRRLDYHVASRMECLICHTTRAGSILGFKPRQLDRSGWLGLSEANPQSARSGGSLRSTPAIPEVDQLSLLDHTGLFAEPVPDEPPLPDPYNTAQPLDDRARAYLHVNCAHCHRRGGGGTATFELMYDLDLSKTGAVGTKPTQGRFAIDAARVIAPGDPFRSVLYYRMATLGRGRMPHFGSHRVDARGLSLLRRWIERLPEAAGESMSSETVTELRARQQKAIAELENGNTGAVDELLQTTSGALWLMSRLDAGGLSENVRQAALDAAAAHPQPHIKSLFERFLPEEQRTQRLGNSIDPQEILAIPGNANRGQRLFFQAEGVQCRNCHKINDKGREVGPDLSKIGKKYDRAELLESLLKPSKKIDAEFAAYLMETSAGRIHSGVLVKRTAEEVVLRNGKDEPVRVPADDVELLVRQQKSLMPERLLNTMTARQVADLLAFLDSLE